MGKAGKSIVLVFAAALSASSCSECNKSDQNPPIQIPVVGGPVLTPFMQQPQSPQLNGGDLEPVYFPMTEWTKLPSSVGQEAELTGLKLGGNEKYPVKVTLAAPQDDCLLNEYLAGHYDPSNPPEIRIYRVKDPQGNPLCTAPEFSYMTDRPKRCENEGYVPNQPKAQYKGTAIAVRGWNPAEIGTYGSNTFVLSCAGAVMAKCAHWGFVPNYQYRSSPDAGAGEPLSDYFSACVHAAQAVYHPGDAPGTCASTYIDIEDRLGIQKPDRGGMKWEAAFGTIGAVPITQPARLACVNPRCIDCKDSLDGGTPPLVLGCPPGPPPTDAEIADVFSKNAAVKVVVLSRPGHGRDNRCVKGDYNSCPDGGLKGDDNPDMGQ